jgi:transposase
MQFGYWGAEDMEITSTKFIKKLGKKFDTYPKQLVRVLEYLCEQWLRLSEEIKRLDIEIQKETQENPLLEELEGIYRSVPGIGKISSNELCRELGDLSQFSNIKKAYSFTGLTPSESSSGEKVRRGHISHCGRPRIRKLLIEIAWRSINRDKSLSEKFKRIAGERGKKRAIVAIARILVGRMRACLLSKKNYELTAIS